MLFLRVFQHLLPRARAFSLAANKTLRKFFEGFSSAPADVRTFADEVYGDLLPDTTRALGEWERQFGLEPNPSETVRRQQLAAEWASAGGQSPAYIESVLQTAGFDLHVHEWWSSGPPYVARDPRQLASRPLLGTRRCSAFRSGPRCSGFPSQPRCNAFLGNDPHYLVNQDLTKRAPPPIPDDPKFWPFFMYIGGATFPDRVVVDRTRRAELERLLLKLRPTQQWIVMLVNYGERVFDESFDRTFS